MPGFALPPHPLACPDGRVILPAGTPRLEWLAARRQFLCASDVAAALGVPGAWGDPFTVWADKLGLTPHTDGSTDRQQFGLDAEDFIIKHWVNTHREPELMFRRVGFMQSTRYRRAAATLDRLSVCARGRCITELKAHASVEQWGTDDDPEVPAEIQVQGQWQLGCTGRDHVHFLVLGPRQTVLHRVMERDQELIDRLFYRGAQWWGRHVIGQAPPDATARADDVIRSVYGNPTRGAEHVLTDAECEVMHRIRRRAAVLATVEGRQADDLAWLQARVGNATEILWPGEAPELGGKANPMLAATFRPSKVIDGADKKWVTANAELVEPYRQVEEVVTVNVPKLVEDLGHLPDGLRYRRTFSLKGMK